MNNRARHILNLALAATGFFAAGAARGEILGCEPLANVKTHNRYEFDSSTCDFSTLQPGDENQFAKKREDLAAKIAILDYQIIARMAQWLDPENAIPSVTVKIESRETLHLDGKFSPEAPTTIVLSDDIFKSSAISFVAFHELQHLYNFHFKGDAYVDDWLNEGLSVLVQNYFTKKVPSQALQKISLDGRTPPLLEFSNEISDVEGRAYTNTGLFVIYLARHLGGLNFVRELIRGPQTGIPAVITAAQDLRAKNANQIEDKFLNLNSLFLNYSVALAVNSPRYSFHDLFSFGGAGFFDQLSTIRIAGQLLVLPAVGDHLEQIDALAPYQSEFYVVPTDYKCLRVTANAETEIYKIVNDGRLRIEPVHDNVAAESKPFQLLIVNYAQPHLVKLSESQCR